MRNNIICFTKFPKTNELLHIFATVHSLGQVTTSFYNIVIKKCRQLIYENSNVLASPSLEGLYGIHIIIKESDYETGLIQKYLADHNLKSGAPSAVAKYVYEECCLYTIIAKLAPKWNLVHQYFVRGRDFLTNPNIKDCVRLSLCISDNGDATLIFTVTRINLPTMSLEKLEIPRSCMQELTEKGVVTFNTCTARPIRVLPSLKRGNILSINLRAGENWCFKNYIQFRRHWKNTYGYRLPPTDESVFYLEISFFDGSPIFTYPSLCIRPNEPTFLKRIEPEPVLACYLADLMKCMPTIFNDTYPVPSYVTQPKPQLFSGAENLDYSNARSFDLTIAETQNSAIVYLPTQTQTPNVENNVGNEEPKSKLSQLLSQLDNPEHQVSIYLTQKSQLTQGISQTQQSVLNEKLNKPETPKNKLNSKPKKHSKLSEEIKSQAQFLSQKLAEQKSTINILNIKQSVNEKMPPKIVPKFKSKFPKIKPLKKVMESQIKPQSQIHTIGEPESDLDSLKDFDIPAKKIETSDIDSLKDFDTTVKKMETPAIVTSNKELNKNKEVKPKKQQNNLEKVENNNNMDRKRVNVVNKSEASVPKKPREKPAPVEINNMKELVYNGEVSKLNNNALLKWLKDRKIHCTTKDKKSVLLEKIVNVISKE